MNNDVLTLTLLCYSAGLFGFGLMKEIYRLSRMVFGFYLVVFSLAWSHYFYFHGFLSQYYFSLTHVTIFLITVFTMVYKLLNEFEKYKTLIVVIMTSIVFVICLFLWFADWFRELHTIVLLVDLTYVTWFVLQVKIKKMEKKL